MARRPSSVCLSVRPSVCKLLRKSLLLADKWPDRDQTSTRWTPGQRASRMCSRSRSKVTYTGTFVLARKSLLLPGKWLDRDQNCTRSLPGKPASRVCSRSRSRSKVTWYVHFLGFLEWATPSLTVWLAHSKNELMQWRSVPRLSVCKLLRKSLFLAGNWPDRHQTCTRWSPGKPASRMCSRSRSKVTW